MRATKLEWLEAIKSPAGDHTNISGLAIERTFGNSRTRILFITGTSSSKTNTLLSAFGWSYTPEGHRFWRNIREFNRNN